MNSFVLGVDGGGSKTIGILVDRSGEVVRMARCSGINPQDRSDWQVEFGALIGAFFGDVNRLDAGCIGAPGYGEVPSISAIQEAFFKSSFDCPVLVENDVRVAFDGAFLSASGILLLVGTGSMAWASDGMQHARFGGWGEIYGDEGSGFWIGREALSIASRQLDGRLERTGFCLALLQYLAIGNDRPNDDLLAWAYGQEHQRSAIAAIAGFVNAQAIVGDPTAMKILRDACEKMAEHIAAAKSKFGQKTPWSIAGGVSKSHFVRKYLSRQFGPHEEKHLPPVGGAAWRAATAAGWKADGTWVESLRKSLIEHGVDS